MADAKSTPSYSSDLHFSVFQNRPDRGVLIFSKICSRSSKPRKKVKNGICPIKKFDIDAICNGWNGGMNGTTSAPLSVLHYVVDKVKLFAQ